MSVYIYFDRNRASKVPEPEEIVEAVERGGDRRAAAAEDEAFRGPMSALKALAHPARWTMMELIHRRGGEICVCEFQKHLDLSQPTISHHLKTLREAGLIESRQEGTWVYHTLRRDAVGAVAEGLASWARPASE